jgi:putative flippase GtrA
MVVPTFSYRTRALVGVIARELSKFGVVGLLALFVDVGTFNLLRFAGGEGPLYEYPLAAKVLSAAAATVLSWVGNRYWTFRRHRRAARRREFALFVAVCVVGTLLALACLAFSHYVLGLTSPVADNVSANVVGLALGTTFRFWAYRRYVFNSGRYDSDPGGPGGPAGAAEPQRRSTPAFSRIRSTMASISKPSAMVLPRSPVTDDSPTRGW